MPPATEQTKYNMKVLHVVFGVSTLVMLRVATATALTGIAAAALLQGVVGLMTIRTLARRRRSR